MHGCCRGIAGFDCSSTAPGAMIEIASEIWNVTQHPSLSWAFCFYAGQKIQILEAQPVQSEEFWTLSERERSSRLPFYLKTNGGLKCLTLQVMSSTNFAWMYFNKGFIWINVFLKMPFGLPPPSPDWQHLQTPVLHHHYRKMCVPLQERLCLPPFEL